MKGKVMTTANSTRPVTLSASTVLRLSRCRRLSRAPQRVQVATNPGRICGTDWNSPHSGHSRVVASGTGGS